MIERVARALFETSWRRSMPPFLRWEDFDQTPFFEDARAAIEAMREPTDEQRNRYFELSHRTEVMNDAHWERMIDAALQEPKT